MMDNLDNQIRQFWENKTTPEQRREILRQLEASGMEWQEFMRQYYTRVLSGEEPGSFTSEQKSRIWERIHEQHLQKRTQPRIMWLPWMAAASIILIVGLFIFRQNQTKKSPEGAFALDKFIEKNNTGKTDDSITLPDHSIVLLSPGSTIRYQENFEVTSRNIVLEGKALFEVAKDSARPFSVTAHGLKTTALGTRFIVDATKRVISIHLLKGKIVVNATGDIAMQNVYLTPGQELKIDTETKRFDLRNTTEETQTAVANKKTHRSKPNPPTDQAKPLTFESTDLAAVFQQLSEYYKTSILYDKAEVQGMSFTGEFKPSDELDLALKVICNMNRLSFIKENDHIVISKQQ